MSEGIPNTKNSFENKENDFFRKLQTLPLEIAERWQLEYDNLDEITEDFYTKFESFLDKRRIIETGFIEVYGEISSEMVAEIQNVTKMIIEVYNNPSEHLQNFLGDGRTAKVYSLPIAQNLCVKFIYYDSPVDIPIDKEVEILGKLRDFSVSGIRTPIPYFKQVQSGTRHFYGMERIQGKNLFQIVHYPQQNRELIEIAKKLDPEKVIEQLTTYVEQLYQEFKIVHGDLRQSNIMLGQDGQIYVIDFGKSKNEEVGEKNDIETRMEADKLLLASEVRDFFKKIDRLDTN